jgi:hypothetical protein
MAASLASMSSRRCLSGRRQTEGGSLARTSFEKEVACCDRRGCRVRDVRRRRTRNRVVVLHDDAPRDREHGQPDPAEQRPDQVADERSDRGPRRIGRLRRGGQQRVAPPPGLRGCDRGDRIPHLRDVGLQPDDVRAGLRVHRERRRAGTGHERRGGDGLPDLRRAEGRPAGLPDRRRPAGVCVRDIGAPPRRPLVPRGRHALCSARSLGTRHGACENHAGPQVVPGADA